MSQLLLDTHALLWWLAGDEKLSQKAREVIAVEASTIFISAASIWEIATKFRLGKLPGVEVFLDDVSGCLSAQGMQLVAITHKHALRAGLLPGPHRDPFDRMLIAQAQEGNLVLVSNEEVFDSYGVRRLW
jgi:PIN domain nuclease of toxin-antitoxin system